MAKFILNDETKLNSYGFRVLNAGIDFTRFNANPVMLDQHINSTKTVIGRWNNINIEGTNLVADSEFDTSDPEAKELEGKVERGFIKGASIGISFDPVHMVTAKDGNLELTQCEIFEASICAIPSNANAITLYSKAGKPMSEKTFKLSILPLKQQIKKLNMDLLQSLIKLLGLSPEATEQDVLNAVETLINDKENAAETQAKELVKMAVADGRITILQEDFYIDAAKRNYSATFNALQNIQPRVTLSAMLKKTSLDKADKANWSLDDYRRNAPKELQQNPALYQKLIEKQKQG